MDVKVVLRNVAISVGAGVAVGIAVDRIIAWRRARKYEEALDSYSYPEEEYDWEEREYLEIPEGVNVVGADTDGDRDILPSTNPDRASGPLYRKPDLSEMVDYTKFSKDDKKEEDDDPGEEAAYVHLISEEEFVRGTGNLDGYVSVTGTWFVQDHILAGWDLDLAEKDPSTTIGEKAVEKFDDPEVKAIYVRNDLLKVLFEVVRSDDLFDLAYQEVLKAESEEPYPGEA